MALTDVVPFAVANWTFDGSGPGDTDTIGANDLTEPNSWFAQWGSTTGKFDGCRTNSSGESAYFDSPDTADLSITGTSFAIVAWVYFGSPSFMGLVTKDDSGQESYNLGTETDGSGNFRFQWSVHNGSTYTTLSNSYGSGFNQWRLVVAQYDATNGQLRLSMDGASSSITSISGTPVNGTSRFRIGRYSSGTGWSGRIDDITIVKNRVITDSEIAEIWDSGTGKAFANWGGGGGGGSNLPVFHHHFCQQGMR